MKIEVRMFGALAERAGTNVASVIIDDGAIADDVVAAVGASFPDVRTILERTVVAVNLEVVSGAHRVDATDEIALLPPMSGGASIAVGLRDAPSVDEALALARSSGAGGTAVFVGTVRDTSDAGTVDLLEYSAYGEMAEKVMTDIAVEGAEKWGLASVVILHGVGVMRVGDVTMVVACAAAHRAEAFDACRYVVDEVKRRVPVWKKETGPWGSRWVGT